ncbi:MAG: gamma-glutamyltransferase [Sphaerochaetaceae bacterium]|nr:gamma-glutamyltransferase [Sphaerochaetaceae bacterium]
MKKTVSKIAISLVVMLMAFALIGCSKPVSDSTTTTAAAPAAQSTTTTTAQAAAPAPVVDPVAPATPVVEQKVVYEWPSDIFGTGAVGANGAAACASPIASQIAVDIMEQGGNAIDAAVAMIYAVGLLEPAATGIGGAGQMTVYLAAEDKYITIEYMTQAPGAAIAETIDTSSSENPPSVQSIAIPGQVYGTLTALENWGTMTPAQVLAPVIKLAREGFPVSERWNTNIEGRYANLSNYEYTLGLYTDEGFLYSVGDKITNKDLANTYEMIANEGIKGFYDSEFTDKMVEHIQSLGGILTHEDFAQYKAVIREPISTTYRGYTVYTVGGPSTGGAALLEALNILENFDLKSYGADSPETVNLMAEAFTMGYKDGNGFMADPIYYNCPVDTIISKEYAAERATKLNPTAKQKVVGSGKLKVTLTETGKEVAESAAVDQGGTSHMVAMDKYGNVVSTTNTNGINFGSAVAVPGTGFVFTAHLSNLNNSATASVNMLMPYIKVCSTTCPSIVADASGKPVLAVGSPGNWALVSAALAAIVNYIDFDMDIAQAVNAPRTWKDGMTIKDMYMEGGYSQATIDAVAAMGYNLMDTDREYSSHVGNVAAIEVKDGLFYAIGDDRRHYGAAAY